MWKGVLEIFRGKDYSKLDKLYHYMYDEMYNFLKITLRTNMSNLCISFV